MDKNNKIERSNSKKGKGTILIVDDEIAIRRLLKKFIDSKGFFTHEAHLADGALEILDETRVDLVITNIRMPGMDGLDLTRLIKDRYGLDVIIMTGYHSFSYEEALRVGASDVLHKPAKMEDLLESIKRVLNR